MSKPLLQARYRGKPEWDWEYTTRGYTVTDLEMAKKPTYKWLEEAKKRGKPLQVQVVIVDPEHRWGEVMWEDFYLKNEFWKGCKEVERCLIAHDITKDVLHEQCKIDDDKCKIAKEISEDIVSRECEAPVKEYRLEHKKVKEGYFPYKSKEEAEEKAKWMFGEDWGKEYEIVEVKQPAFDREDIMKK